MASYRWQRLIRKSHRYLGISIGVQFLFWTLGGLYFSWTTIDEVRGTTLKRDHGHHQAQENLVSIDSVLARIETANGKFQLAHLRTFWLDHVPYFELEGRVSGEKETRFAANAHSGQLIAPLSEQEATTIALAAVKEGTKAKKVVSLTAENVGHHHEYRESPLPAFAVETNLPGNAVVYVDALTGAVTKIRTDQWRLFDFLWMLHTMDYQARDNINNWLLRAFSVLGIITLGSGFWLYFLTSPTWRKKKN